MQIRVTDGSVEIDGYVNAVERESRPLPSRLGKFIERIKKGAFKRALSRNDNVKLLLNHDWNKCLGGTREGNLELTEDNIGLRARATITEPDVVAQAKRGDLIGWSFGFKDVPNGVTQTLKDGVLTREVSDLDLYEVSLINKQKTPAYEGTLVTVRAEDDFQYQSETFITDLEVREDISEKAEEEPKQHENVEENTIDYSRYEAMINDMEQED